MLYVTKMCGRFTLTRKQLREVAQALEAEFDPEAAGLYHPRYNIAPSNTHWIFRPLEEKIWLKPAIWGLHPHWLKRKEGFINTRLETAAEKPAFREALKKRRCVIPADGFYEWSPSTGGKQPFWFSKPDQKLFLFAGLYEIPKEESALPTFSILTTEAEGISKKYHDRMPVILSQKTARSWIEAPIPKDANSVSSLLEIVKEHETELQATAVSKRVNSPKFDDAELIQKVST